MSILIDFNSKVKTEAFSKSDISFKNILSRFKAIKKFCIQSTISIQNLTRIQNTFYIHIIHIGVFEEY